MVHATIISSLDYYRSFSSCICFSQWSLVTAASYVFILKLNKILSPLCSKPPPHLLEYEAERYDGFSWSAPNLTSSVPVLFAFSILATLVNLLSLEKCRHASTSKNSSVPFAWNSFSPDSHVTCFSLPSVSAQIMVCQQGFP